MRKGQEEKVQREERRHIQKDERKRTNRVYRHNIYDMHLDTVRSVALHSYQIVLAISAYHRRSALAPGYIRRA